MTGSMDYEKMYEACYMQVYSFVMTLCRDGDMAEEITQNTFLKAMTAGRKAEFQEKSDPVTWLCAIAKNLFNDEMRRNRNRSEMPEDAVSGDDVEAAATDKEMSYRIHVVLHSLEEPYKEVFQLRVFGELSFAQIGSLFGKTENWARVTYHRARLRIQERMDKYE